MADEESNQPVAEQTEEQTVPSEQAPEEGIGAEQVAQEQQESGETSNETDNAAPAQDTTNENTINDGDPPANNGATEQTEIEKPAKGSAETNASESNEQPPEQQQEPESKDTEEPNGEATENKSGEQASSENSAESNEQAEEKEKDETTKDEIKETTEEQTEPTEATPAENAAGADAEKPADGADDKPTEDAAADKSVEEEKEARTADEPVGEKQAEESTEKQLDQAIEIPTDKQAESEQKAAPTATDQAQEKEPEKPAAGQVATSTTPVPTDRQEADVDPHAASPTPRGAAENTATCTVKFMLMPSGQVYTERCGLGQSLLELKQHLSNELKIPTDVIMLTHDGKEAKNEQVLPDLGVGPNGTVQLEILSTDPTSYPIKTLKKRVDYQMPDVITVRVFTETNEVKDVVVEIERATRKKPFLGGYRHKKNGIEYHHAAAQTMQKQRPPSNTEKNCRDTQTSEQRHEVQQTTNDMSTQMTKIGVYVSNIPDKLIVPGKYTTADEYKKNVFNRILVIQKYYRRWLAKRYVERVREDKARRLEWEREEELKKKKEKEDRIKREFERRMNPKTQEDFDLLYHALEKWRQEELERINAELAGAERKAALCQLLDQETQLIASIGRHKLDADEENRTKTIQSFLEKAAAPKKWRGHNGRTTEMDTPYTIRAQELKDIYNSINMKYLTQDERLDVLLTLKHTVKEHDCKLTQEIIELIDREADLLMRGVKESNLEGLRRRISTLFLQYIKTPTFNPEAARLLKVPQDPSVLRKDIYYCQSCNQYKPSTEFQLSSNTSTVGRCRKCNKIDNDARIRQDYSHYRYMVKALRRSEEAYGDGSQIAYLLQEGDLRYLVENVWNSQSILSAWEDLYDLVLVRWDRHHEWSPWNCILVTKEEAASHDKLENLDEAYGKTLIHKVKHKHTLARNYFSRLPGMAEFMRNRGDSSKMAGRGGAPSVAGKAVPVAPVQ